MVVEKPCMGKTGLHLDEIGSQIIFISIIFAMLVEIASCLLPKANQSISSAPKN